MYCIVDHNTLLNNTHDSPIDNEKIDCINNTSKKLQPGKLAPEL
jgi:hypothetical protein